MLGLEERLPDDGVARDGLLDDARHQVPRVDASVDLDSVGLRPSFVMRSDNEVRIE